MSWRSPALGPRGEGWVVLQLVLFAAIAAAGLASLARAGASSAWGPGAVAVGATLVALGGLIAVGGAIGLRTSLSPFPRPVEGGTLIRTGVYRWIRHPIYAGIILAGVGWSVATSAPIALALVLGLFLLFDAKSRREEAWLVERYPEYAAYRATTRRFVPWIY